MFVGVDATIRNSAKASKPKEWAHLDEMTWGGKEESVRCLQDIIYDVQIHRVYKVKSILNQCIIRMLHFSVTCLNPMCRCVHIWK